MATAVSVSWEELSSSTRDAFALAVGCLTGSPQAQLQESEDLGVALLPSGALLVGIFLSHDGTSEEEQLLEHFGRSRQDLERALVETTPAGPETVPFDPTVKRWVRLDDVPALMPDAEEILRIALDLARSKHPPPRTLPLRFLFGGVLHASSSDAYRALEASDSPTSPGPTSTSSRKAPTPDTRISWPSITRGQARMPWRLRRWRPSRASTCPITSDRSTGHRWPRSGSCSPRPRLRREAASSTRRSLRTGPACGRPASRCGWPTNSSGPRNPPTSRPNTSSRCSARPEAWRPASSWRWTSRPGTTSLPTRSWPPGASGCPGWGKPRSGRPSSTPARGSGGSSATRRTRRSPRRPYGWPATTRRTRCRRTGRGPGSGSTRTGRACHRFPASPRW